MKKILLLLYILIFYATTMIAQPLRIVMIGAHPDDCDLDGGGTAILYAQMGHQVKFVSVTNGDAGHQSQGGGALAKRRTEEAKEAGKRFGIAEYVVLDNHDGELVPSLDIRLQIIREIRKWNADVVISHRPNDYHPDHRYTGVLVQDAAFMVGVPNIAPDTPPVDSNPVFLYFHDHFQKPNPFRPDIAVDISSVIDQKMHAVAAHESQFFEWLPWIGQTSEKHPTDQQERIEWLKKQRERELSPEIISALTNWYGEKGARNANHVEVFEICEYGKQPNEAEIRRLFPMLK